MTHEIVELIGQYGVLVVFLNVLVEQIGLPVPSLPTLIVAGAIAASGSLDPIQLFAVAVVACVVADALWFIAGRRYGSRVMRTLCRLSLTPDSCVGETQARFERWGVNALVAAKFVPGLSTIAPPLAGATLLAWPRFLWFDTLGSALWVGAGLGVGMFFNAQIDQALMQLDEAGSQVLTVTGVLLLSYVAFKWQQRRTFIATLRMARIDVDELYRLMTAGADPVVVDVRSATARAIEPRQIPGARHIPLDGVDREVTTLPRERDIVLYCTCPNEASAARVAKLLIKHGFTRVRPLTGGLDAWIAAGYALEQMRESIPAER